MTILVMVLLMDKVFFLLGIDWGHFDFEGEIVKNDASSLRIPSGMMCVVPAWKLDELIRSIEVK